MEYEKGNILKRMYCDINGTPATYSECYTDKEVPDNSIIDIEYAPNGDILRVDLAGVRN